MRKVARPTDIALFLREKSEDPVLLGWGRLLTAARHLDEGEPRPSLEVVLVAPHAFFFGDCQLAHVIRPAPEDSGLEIGPQVGAGEHFFRTREHGRRINERTVHIDR